MSASSKLLRIVAQQRRMAALAYGEAITQKENLERDLQSKQSAIVRSEETLMEVMQSSRSNKDRTINNCRISRRALAPDIASEPESDPGLAPKRLMNSGSNRSGSPQPDANEPIQTMQALSFHQCELGRLNGLVEVTRKELASSEMQIRELRKNYEVLHSREEALGILIQKDEQKRRAERIHAEQTNLDEVTVQRWENHTV